jgi:hypothetical protein
MTAKTKTLDDLRAPFPASVIGKLPKGNTVLDYVGHAAVTDRLLTVDPEWSWEPLAYDEQGLPAYDRAGGLWIKLTVLGTTRFGYGDGPDPKQRIGDAIRNASMRFGVALDLWTKGELESQDPNGGGGDTVRHTAPRDSYAARPPEPTVVRQPYDPDAAEGWLSALEGAESLEGLRLMGDALSGMKRTGRITEEEFDACAAAGKRRKTELEADAALTQPVAS